MLDERRQQVGHTRNVAENNMKKSKRWLIATCVVLVFVGCRDTSSSKQPVEDGTSNTPGKLDEVEIPVDLKGDPGEAVSFFVVDHYDPERDAVKDLEMATKLASKSGKRILIEVGGKW